jgi:5-methylcytosine-specific restriction endonuclease McrA
MARPFQFKTPAQSEARLRQAGRCAQCGDSLDDEEEHAHHVVPNQSGNPRDPNHAWLASSENCVVLCHVCHGRVHQDGRTRTGAVAPPSYFKHSHGENTSAHLVWAKRLAQREKTVWPAQGQ